MGMTDLDITFEPKKLKANSKNETAMVVKMSTKQERLLWCECDILLKYPLSLAFDRELKAGHSRIGLLRKGKFLEKRFRLYTMPNNQPGQYLIGVVTYAYGEDGVIEDRQQTKLELECV